jgi:hypothetical protein
MTAVQTDKRKNVEIDFLYLHLEVCTAQNQATV